MGSFTLEMKGKDKLITRFDNLSRKLEAEVKYAVTKHTFDMETKAKKNAPYDTGHLKRSIGSQFFNGKLSGEVSTNVHYAIYVEVGTRYMRAQPFMFPAFIVTRAAFMRDLKRIFKDVQL